MAQEYIEVKQKVLVEEVPHNGFKDGDTLYYGVFDSGTGKQTVYGPYTVSVVGHRVSVYHDYKWFDLPAPFPCVPYPIRWYRGVKC